MKHWLPVLTVVTVLAACPSESEFEQTCEDLCAELVTTCQYAAFPDLASCLQGCRYNAEELDADVANELVCVQGAACDAFAIIECEHLYGVE